jgi:hypothetical protein
MDTKWRFPGNSYTIETGLDTSNMEMFKRDPISSLAREICQNSIDARLNENNPVKVSFSLFTLDNHQVPGVSRLLKELRSCRDYMIKNEEKKIEIEEMIKAISKNKITVLRISDFNTTGLVGVKDSSDNSQPWYLLTKGSGISYKTGTTGGSKGIGKYATFVSSSFRTVFYATYTQFEEVGHQGIVHFMSTYSEENREEKTIGVGFYGQSEKNDPILNNVDFDTKFSRDEKEYGTDIYIFGFDYVNWEKEVISKILESFMVAIKKNDLIVDVNKQLVDKDTIHDIVTKKHMFKLKDYKSIYAQYSMLFTEGNYHKKHVLEGLGEFDIYIKGYSNKESQNATNTCMMVRYPYMKIKDLKNLTHIPHSAMCVINKDSLNARLRKIENPEHIDWEFKRIKDPTERKTLVDDYNKLKALISDEIKDYLLKSDANETDIDGASEYLPDNEEGNEEKVEPTQNTYVSKPINITVKPPIGVEPSEVEESFVPDEGGDGEEDGESIKPGEGGGGGGGDGFETPGTGDGADTEIQTKHKLSGILHKFFITDKKLGQYRIVIVPPFDEEKVLVEIMEFDDNNKKTKIHTKNTVIDSLKIPNSNKILVKFETGKKVVIDLNVHTLYKLAVEVELYAIR